MICGLFTVTIRWPTLLFHSYSSIEQRNRRVAPCRHVEGLAHAVAIQAVADEEGLAKRRRQRVEVAAGGGAEVEHRSRAVFPMGELASEEHADAGVHGGLKAGHPSFGAGPVSAI